MFQLFIILSYFLVLTNAVGPAVIATKGEVWPQPQQQEKTDDYYTVRPHTFSFRGPADIECVDLLNDAFTRYWSIIAISASRNQKTPLTERIRNLERIKGRAALGALETLNVAIEEVCPEDILPAFGDNEDYNLTINADEANLSAVTIWGALRGLETFTQLIHLEQDELVINTTTIRDFPRFPFRGLLIDTARHFIPVDIILQNLDAMAYNKLNVFHWHIVDDQSFPYSSRIYPELSEQGAYHPVSKVYSQSDIARIIEYARIRGIRVIPEFDSPGHTNSWGVAHPELLTACYSNNQPNGNLGPIDPSKPTTYDFLTTLFGEIVEVFPDVYFHIGGDEVDFSCWESNPDITAFMAANDISSYQGLESFYIQNVVNILDFLNASYLVWEEVFVDGVILPPPTLVHVWKEPGFDVLTQVLEAEKYAVFSSCWYLDHLNSGGDWQKYYDCEPMNITATEEQKQLLLGGEACMWSESVNEYNIVPRIWPRASATAEKLWSAEEVNDYAAARPRLEEHTCRMNKRGIAAQPPNGPGVCL